MESNIINRVEEIRVHSNANILNRQRHKIPYYIHLYPEIVWDAYYIAGDRFTITGDFQFGMRVHNLPYNEDVINKKDNPYFIDDLKNMVERNEIRPMLIFFKNKLVAWSRIKIVHDITTSYMLIANLDDYESIDDSQFRCIAFPFNIYYEENIDNIPELRDFSSFISFTRDGLFDLSSRDIIIKPNDPAMLMYAEERTNINKSKALPIITEKQYTISPNNCLAIFYNGELSEDYMMHVSSDSTVSLSNKTESIENPEGLFGYMIFCPLGDDNINSNRHIFKVRDDFDNSDNRLYNSLDLPLEPDKLYEEAIDDALTDIVNYDIDLMKSIFSDASMVVSREYTGLEFIRLARNGYIRFNENHKKQVDDKHEVLIRIHPMIFVNNLLYENIHAMHLENHQIVIPVNGIKIDDKVEILMFKEVVNDVFTHGGEIFDDKKSSTYTTTQDVISELTESNYEIYTRKPVEDAEVKMTSVDDYDRVQFKVNIKNLLNNNDKIGFTISDNYAGSVPLTLVSKQQFRHYGFYANRVGFNFMLTPDFNYCINKNQYMVFVNGRKINQDNFILISATPKQPFDDISIYMTFEFDKGDKVDVFYVTTVCHEFVLAPRIPMSGNIYLDRTKLDYGFDKDFFLMFINGKKIYPSQLTNINSSKLCINTNIESLNDICILKHISTINSFILDKFKADESEWDKITNDKDLPTLRRMLGLPEVTISDNEVDFNADQVGALEITTEIARDYWMSERIYHLNDGMIYDYDDIKLNGKDFFGAQITDLENALIDYERTHTENHDEVSDEEFTNTATYH